MTLCSQQQALLHQPPRLGSNRRSALLCSLPGCVSPPPAGQQLRVGRQRAPPAAALLHKAATASVAEAVQQQLPALAQHAGHVGPITELSGFWSQLISEHLHHAAPQLGKRTAYLISHGTGHLLIPLLEAVLLVAIVKRVAAAANAWCEANPDKPFSREVLGLLPAALQGPTVVTVYLALTVRLVRNAAYLVANLVHMCDRTTFGTALSGLIDGLADNLLPLDRAVFKVYLVLAIIFLGTVLANWKSIGLTFLLERERDATEEAQEAAAAALAGDASSPSPSSSSSPSAAAAGARAAGASSAARREAEAAAVAKRAARMEELERLVVPLDAASNWLIYLMCAVACAQVLGLNVAPLIAVGGAGSIILGLATQQLLTNALMGLSLFFTRPFVNGDSVMVQAAGLMVSGVVENITVMRTTLRTADDTIVTIPNKVVADATVHNASADVRRSRLARLNRASDTLKLRLKLPYAAEGRLRDLQEVVGSVLEPPPGSGGGSSRSGGSASSLLSEPGSPVGSMSADGDDGSGSRAVSPAPFIGHPVAPRSVEVVLSKFTDGGLELLVKAKLRAEPSSPAVQGLLLELSRRVRALGGVMVNL